VYETPVPVAKSKKGLMLLLPDGFGLATHNLVLADSFAQEGWHIVVPDYFEGQHEKISLHNAAL
jgi:dienelactone hydrolase